ncbi:MAG TPA: FHA domain-containing protein [Candidatus Angelobacter sp.]|nr:FHA domain-containing protein [Candidatus Angelobacter sp.]
MKIRHSKPATDEDEIETGPGTSTEVSTPHAASTGNWKCPSCGAENEDYRTFCDGCGDKRPGAKVASKGIDMASLLGSSESSDDTSAKDDASSSWEDSPKDSPKKEKSKKGKKIKKGKNEDDEEAEPLKAEPLEQEKIEPPEGLSPSGDLGGQKPSFVLSGPTAEPESDDSQTAAPSPPVFEPSPMASFQQTPQASSASSGSHYYLVFVNTPASSLLKTRVSIDFDDFPTITIGRSPENVVVIPDQEVSRKHASLSFSGSRLMLKDLGSLNGTFLYDGKEFQRVSDSVEVKPNNVLKLGTGTIVKLVSE